jgi:hypothetical protein
MNDPKHRRSPMTRHFAGLTVSLAMAAGLAAPAQPPSGKLDSKRYVDPKGNFSIVPPAGWKAQEYPSDPRGKVAFEAPEGRMDLRVLTNAVDFKTIDDLVTSLKSIEGRIGMSTNIRKTTFLGRAAVERSMTIKGVRLATVDFLVGQTAHNLQFAAPPGLFEKYQPLALLSMQTYEPREKKVTSADVNAQTVAKMRRLAELMLQNGQTDLAADYVRRGLEVDPKNADLVKLRAQIKARGAAK